MDTKFQRGRGAQVEKIMEIPGGGGSTVKPTWNGKSWGVGGQTGKNPLWGVWIFSGTTHLVDCSQSPIFP